eukprot:CAMPEP_0114424056 /NCGR_PEP_ID=MMETSP0103-20121206/6485_1 /TAXON_ID=37642 ORGANISM="Paraphysomonas imperforata, Strain PA2" /NCGR_SAMPLE_ID=MMETSP0103 /ASSEMBLY_ACC=CAM_ASM_000201 /LENGTH=96 /DNA_ID=CAMNT_0001592773 /DNA_START=476 /DNA_END=766 /DNA_ORIENTATION=-
MEHSVGKSPLPPLLSTSSACATQGRFSNERNSRSRDATSSEADAEESRLKRSGGSSRNLAKYSMSCGPAVQPPVKNKQANKQTHHGPVSSKNGKRV